MKQIKFFALAFAALSLLSCSKENADNQIVQNVNKEDVKTITFSASIDPVNSKAILNDHSVEWSVTDIIAVANDVNDDIEACVVTPDGTDPTKCTFTVTAVAGATTYYAICKGNSVSGITFDHTTGVFSGLNNENHSFVKNNVSEARLTMAGKSTDMSSICFAPCLTLVKFKIAAESVAAKYADGYSGIRGFNLIIKHNGNRIHPTGDYSVDLSGSDVAVSYVANGADFIQINEGENLMSSTADYYVTVIPEGNVETFQIQPFGFNSSSAATWDGIYHMTLTQSASLNPGDYFDLGTLNPLGLQKARDAFVPAISIDGNFTDWNSITTTGGYSNGYTECRATYDKNFIYFYSKTTNITWDSGNYFYYCLDTDNDNTTGGDLWGHAGFECIFYVSPFSSTEGTYRSSPTLHRTYPDSNSAAISCAGSYDSENKVSEIEIAVSRNMALVNKGDVIRIWTYASGSASGYFNLASTLTIEE